VLSRSRWLSLQEHRRGGVYIVSSLVWLAVMERTTPRATDLAGALLCFAGAVVILYGPRLSPG